MFRQILPILFTLFLLSTNIALAEEDNEPTVEEQVPQAQKEDATEEHEVQEKEPLSEAELEALKAEEDEIREAQASD